MRLAMVVVGARQPPDTEEIGIIQIDAHVDLQMCLSGASFLTCQRDASACE